VSVKMLVISDKVAGIMTAPPIPMLARAAISLPVEPEKAAQADPAANASSPAFRRRWGRMARADQSYGSSAPSALGMDFAVSRVLV
jgi:hypothetical protein